MYIVLDQFGTFQGCQILISKPKHFAAFSTHEAQSQFLEHRIQAEEGEVGKPNSKVWNGNQRMRFCMFYRVYQRFFGKLNQVFCMVSWWICQMWNGNSFELSLGITEVYWKSTNLSCVSCVYNYNRLCRDDAWISPAWGFACKVAHLTLRHGPSMMLLSSLDDRLTYICEFWMGLYQLFPPAGRWSISNDLQ